MSEFLSNNVELTFVIATALSAVGVPRLWLVAGLALCLDPIEAFACAFASTVVGSCISFSLARSFLRERVARKLSGTRAEVFARGAPGISEIILIRQSPIPGIVTTTALALSSTKTASFSIGSAIGFLPSTIIITAMGGTVAHDRGHLAMAAIITAIAALFLVGLKHLPKALASREAADRR